MPVVAVMIDNESLLKKLLVKGRKNRAILGQYLKAIFSYFSYVQVIFPTGASFLISGLSPPPDSSALLSPSVLLCLCPEASHQSDRYKVRS